MGKKKIILIHILTLLLVFSNVIASFAYTSYSDRLYKINNAVVSTVHATSYEQSTVVTCNDMQYAGSTTMTKNSDGSYTINSSSNIWNDTIREAMKYSIYTSNSSSYYAWPSWDTSGNVQGVCTWYPNGNGWEKRLITGRVLIITFDDTELLTWGDGTTVSASNSNNSAKRSSVQFSFSGTHYMIFPDYHLGESFGDESDCDTTSGVYSFTTDEDVTYTKNNREYTTKRQYYAYTYNSSSSTSYPYKTSFSVIKSSGTGSKSEWTIKDLPSNCTGVYVVPFRWTSYHHSGSEDDDYSYKTYMPTTSNFMSNGNGVFMKGHTVKYNANGGASTPATAENVQEVTLPSISRVGYTFAGWYNGGTKVGMNGSKYSPDSDVTLVAHWIPRTDTVYTVKHQLMNVNSSGYTLKETEILRGTTDTSVTPSTKTYTGFTAPATQTVNINADGSRVVIYSYSRNKYTFTLSSNASVYSHGIDTSGSSSSGSYYYGATITLKASPKAGYTWSKWSDENTSTSRTLTMPANNLTITPQARLITYTITYVLYNGSVSGNPVTYNVETPTFTLKNPTLSDFTFLGWTSPTSKEVKTSYQIMKGTVGNIVMSANWVSSGISENSLNTQGNSGSSDSDTTDITDEGNARNKNAKTQHNSFTVS